MRALEQRLESGLCIVVILNDDKGRHVGEIFDVIQYQIKRNDIVQYETI